MLESTYSGPFEEPEAPEEGQMTTTVVGAPSGGDEFSITTADPDAAAEAEATDASLDVATNVDGMGFVDQLLVDTTLTRDDVELMLQAVYVAVTLVALYAAMEGQ